MRSIIVGVILLLAGSAQAAIGFQRSNVPEGYMYEFRFGTSASVAEVGQQIETCPVMLASFEQSTAAEVQGYAHQQGESDPASNGDSVVTFSDDTGGWVSIASGRHAMSFVVNTAETSGTSVLRVLCLNQSPTAGSITAGEDVLAYINSLDQLDRAAISYEGGERDYYFSQGTGGLIPTTGNDSTGDGSWGAPFLTCSQMVTLIENVEGVRIWVDGEDGDWVDGGASGNCIGMLDATTPFCDSSKGPCAVVSALDPDHPFVIDANGATAGEYAFECDATVIDSSIIFQNVGLTNAAAGVGGFHADNECWVMGVNPNIVITGNGNDYNGQIDGMGALWVIGPRSYFEVLAASTGSNNRNVNLSPGSGPTSSDKDTFFGWVSTGQFVNDAGTPADIINDNSGAVGDGLVIGPTVSGAAFVNFVNAGQDNPSTPGETDRWEVARTTILQTSGVNYSGFRTTTTGDNERFDLNAYQTSVIGAEHFAFLVGSISTSGSVFNFSCLDCLADAVDEEVVRYDGGAETYSISFQGVIDENDADPSWQIETGNDYSTTAAANAGGLGSFLTNSRSGDLGTTSAACGYREATCGGGNVTPEGVCHPDRVCSTLSGPGSYYMPVLDDFGLRYVLPNTTITGFTLSRGVIGAH